MYRTPSLLGLLVFATVCVHSSVTSCARGTVDGKRAMHLRVRVCVCVPPCIGLHADRFVIRSNHFGQGPTPFYLLVTPGQSQYSSYSNESGVN